TRVAAAVPGGPIAVWDAASGEVVAELPGGHDRRCVVEFSPDGRRLFVTSRLDADWVWDFAGGAAPVSLGEGRGRANAFAFSADGTRVAVCPSGEAPLVFDAGDGRR